MGITIMIYFDQYSLTRREERSACLCIWEDFGEDGILILDRTKYLLHTIMKYRKTYFDEKEMDRTKKFCCLFIPCSFF